MWISLNRGMPQVVDEGTVMRRRLPDLCATADCGARHSLQGELDHLMLLERGLTARTRLYPERGTFKETWQEFSGFE